VVRIAAQGVPGMVFLDDCGNVVCKRAGLAG